MTLAPLWERTSFILAAKRFVRTKAPLKPAQPRRRANFSAAFKFAGTLPE